MFPGGSSTDLAPIQPVATSVHRAVCDHIRSDILLGRLPGGTRLHQSDLAHSYGVSITPVREALRDLAAEGLVDFTAYSGAVVHEPTLDELEQVYQIRVCLMPLAVEAAISRITEADLHLAEEYVDAMGRAGTPDEWVVGNRRLHHVFDDATGKTHLAVVLRRLADLATLYVNISMAPDVARRADADAEHRALLDAYRDRDYERALQLSVDHFTRTLETSRAHFSARKGGDDG